MRIDSARELKSEVLAEIIDNTNTGVAVGLAPGSTVGEYRLALRVRNLSETNVRIVEEIVKRAAHEADVRIVDDLRVPVPESAVRVSEPLRIGAAVAHFRSLGGTLGFFARRRRDGVIGFVSCNHVIADHDNGMERDEVVRPASGGVVGEVVGYLDGGYPRLRQPGINVDCAFAQLKDDVLFEPSRLTPDDMLLAAVARPIDFTSVEKVGRTTGRTRGRISAFDLDGVEIPYTFGSVMFNEQIEIESAGAQPFSRPGDSGSLVFVDSAALGLICAAATAGGRTNAGLTYAHPIDAVLTALDVEIVV